MLNGKDTYEKLPKDPTSHHIGMPYDCNAPKAQTLRPPIWSHHLSQVTYIVVTIYVPNHWRWQLYNYRNVWFCNSPIWLVNFTKDDNSSHHTVSAIITISAYSADKLSHSTLCLPVIQYFFLHSTPTPGSPLPVVRQLVKMCPWKITLLMEMSTCRTLWKSKNLTLHFKHTSYTA